MRLYNPTDEYGRKLATIDEVKCIKSKGTLEVIDGNTATDLGLINNINFSGGYVAIQKTETGKINIFIRENTDKSSFDTCTGFPTSTSRYVYQAANNEYVLPSDATAGSTYARCAPLNSITLVASPTTFKLADNEQTVKAEVLQNGNVLATAETADIAPDKGATTAISTTAQNITISGSAYGISDDDVQQGKTPGTVEVSNLKIVAALATIMSQGGSFKIRLTVGDIVKTYAITDNETFAYTTKTPTTGDITFSLNTSTTRTVSGLTYLAKNTTFNVNVGACTNTCWGSTATANKIWLDTTTINSTSGAVAPTTQSHSGYSDNEVSYTSTKTLNVNKDLTTSLTVKARTYDAAGNTQGEKSSTLTGVVIWDKTSSTTDLVEDFQGETKRLTSALATYDSTTDLGSNDGLLVQNGSLMYPNSGVADNNAKKYSGLTGTRSFYRTFKGTGSALFGGFTITVGGMSNTFNITGLTIKAWPTTETEADAYILTAVSATGTRNVAKSTPTNGTWSCAWLPSTKQSAISAGMIVKVEMTAECATKLTSITISDMK